MIWGSLLRTTVILTPAREDGRFRTAVHGQDPLDPADPAAPVRCHFLVVLYCKIDTWWFWPSKLLVLSCFSEIQPSKTQGFWWLWIDFGSTTKGKSTCSQKTYQKTTGKPTILEPRVKNAPITKGFWWRRSILSEPYRIWAFCARERETPIEVPRSDL